MVQPRQNFCGDGLAHDHAGSASPLFEQGIGQQGLAHVLLERCCGDKEGILPYGHMQGDKIQAGDIGIATAKPAEQA